MKTHFLRFFLYFYVLFLLMHYVKILNAYVKPFFNCLSRPKAAHRPDMEILTSLGLPLRRKSDRHWSIDLSPIQIFTGLSVTSRMIGDELLEIHQGGAGDIVLKRGILSDITPELASLGLKHITVYYRSDVLSGFPKFRNEFMEQMLSVFGTLQRPRWGGLLFPELFGSDVLEQFGKDHNQFRQWRNEPGKNPPALLFPFHLHFEQEEIDYFFLAERDVKGAFLRITIEKARDSRLNLNAIPHLTVDDLSRRTYLSGLSRFVETVYLGIRRESENLRNLYSEQIFHQKDFFTQIRRAGLDHCESLTFRWPSDHSGWLLRSDSESVISFLKKAVLPLEDSDIVKKLKEGSVIEIISGENTAYMDLSRKGKALHISLEEKRENPRIERYLDRMPLVKNLSLSQPDRFQNYRIFLIHHITSEILAVIKALENMGTPRLHVLFVKYAGSVPPDYLETLLTLPEDRFRFHGLARLESADSVEGYYVLSNQYSHLKNSKDLDDSLDRGKLPFFEAMKITAGHLFFREAMGAREEGRKILLIEDGGYLSPLLNRMALEGRTLGEALDFFAIHPEPGSVLHSESSEALGDWLSRILPGTVEHTRNGYDRLLEVQKDFGSLRWPAFSIAVSDLKRDMESREVSVSILHAVESILHGMGRVLSNRRILVLGCYGAIGKYLMDHLRFRTAPDRVSGVDIVFGEKSSGTLPDYLHASSVYDIPEKVLFSTDIFLGVVGKSIIKSDIIEKIILNTECSDIFFVSGSTKTAEFTDLSGYLQSLQKQDSPRIGGFFAEIQVDPIRDPQTSVIQGSCVSVRLKQSEETSEFRTVRLHLLGGLTPINFLYYGVPTETMDPVLRQLLQLSAGFIKNHEQGNPYEPKLHAIDYEVSEDAVLKSMKGSGAASE